MTRYGDDLAAFAHTLVHLVALGEHQPALSEPDAVIAARDTVVGAVHGAFHAAGQIVPDPTLPATPTSQPVCDLAGALSRLYRLAPRLTVADSAGPHSEQPWVDAAMAGLRLEQHLPALRLLPAAAAWTTVGDLAELAATIPYLDADLARRHPVRSSGEAEALADHPLHARLRIAANEVVLQSRLEARDDKATLVMTASDEWLVVRESEQLPAGVRRLAAFVKSRPALSISDLKVGLELTDRLAQRCAAALRAGRTSLASRSAEASDAAEALDNVAAPLRALAKLRSGARTSVPPSAGMLSQARAISTTLTRGSRLADPLALDLTEQTAGLADSLYRAVRRTIGRDVLHEAASPTRSRGAKPPVMDFSGLRRRQAETAADELGHLAQPIPGAVAAARARLAITSDEQRVADSVVFAIAAVRDVIDERRPAAISAGRPPHPCDPPAYSAALAAVWRMHEERQHEVAPDPAPVLEF